MLAFPSFLAPAAVHARLLNALLQREDWARTRLYQHSGKTVRFVAGPIKVNLGINSSGYTHASDNAIVPDVTLTLPTHQISQLPALLKSQDPSGLVAVLHIEGDAGLAQTVSDLARDLRWDIEHDLASRVGDVAASRLLKTGSMLFHTARKSTLHLSENVSEYLGHESNVLLNRPAFTVWRDDLDSTLRRLEKLEARTHALTRASAPSLAITTRQNGQERHV